MDHCFPKRARACQVLTLEVRVGLKSHARRLGHTPSERCTAGQKSHAGKLGTTTGARIPVPGRTKDSHAGRFGSSTGTFSCLKCPVAGPVAGQTKS